MELVNKSLIICGMKSFQPHAGRRARQLVPALGSRPVAIAAAQPTSTDDLKLFWMTLLGGLVFFGTFLA